MSEVSNKQQPGYPATALQWNWSIAETCKWFPELFCAFPVVMYGYESWTVKKAECRRIDALELWCWRRLLRVPWTARRSNQSIPREISPEYSFEGLMLKLTPIVWPPDMKNWLIRKDLDAGQHWRQEEKGTTEDEMAGWHHQFDGHKFEQALGVADGQGNLACCNQWECRVGHDWATEMNWTELKISNQLPRNTYSFCFGLHKLFSGKGASRL